jgi:NAD(P)-dependent dehydrogenase (short-subunit alcohol dehydrogenase family)
MSAFRFNFYINARNGNMFDLKEKVILVVGGRGYLGRDFCYYLNKQNATIISADLKEISKAALKSKDKKSQSGVIQVDIDVTDKDSVSQVVDQIVQKYGKIDVLVFSVTVKPNDFYLPYTECSLEGWQSVIHAELDGVFLVTQKVGRVMEIQQNGSMILLSSMYGVVGNDQRIYKNSNLDSLYADNENNNESEKKQIYSHSVYPTVKGGIISLTRYLAAYWGENNIRVNCISPGGIAHVGENEEFVTQYSERVPLGRKGNLDEISPSIVYLASDESNYITGQNLIIDGGWTAW